MATTGGSCCRGSRSSSRRPILTGSCRTPLQRRHAGNRRAVQHRQPLAVLRLQHAVERLRQHHQDRRFAQHEGGAVRGAHDPAGPACGDLQRHDHVQHRRIESAEHQRWLRERPARGNQPVSGIGRSPRGPRPVHEHRVVRAGQLAREAELHHRRRDPLLLPDPDAERRGRGRGVRSERLAGRSGAAPVHPGDRRRRAVRPRTR